MMLATMGLRVIRYQRRCHGLSARYSSTVRQEE